MFSLVLSFIPRDQSFCLLGQTRLLLSTLLQKILESLQSQLENSLRSIILAKFLNRLIYFQFGFFWTVLGVRLCESWKEGLRNSPWLILFLKKVFSFSFLSIYRRRLLICSWPMVLAAANCAYSPCLSFSACICMVLLRCQQAWSRESHQFWKWFLWACKSTPVILLRSSQSFTCRLAERSCPLSYWIQSSLRTSYFSYQVIIKLARLH